ncbi:hypothetical protein [Kitasatospora griseola]|uniref:hypothetical protein n=1 Tax=Kitasatospora griseola TaxID=2064 RepID=UPI00382E029D
MSDNLRISGEILVDVENLEDFRGLVLRFFSDTLEQVAELVRARVVELSDKDPNPTRGGSVEDRISLMVASPRLGGETERRARSAKNLEWLADRAAEGRTTSAVAKIVEQDGLTVEIACSMRVWRDDADDRWALFWMEVGATASFIRAIVNSMRRVANVADPVFGSIGYGGNFTCTELEYSLGLRGLTDSYDKSRKILRGYDWVTVVPRELANEHGGASGVTKSSNLHSIEELPSGALWLRATDEFANYNGSAVRAMFEAVAPMLPKGLPVEREWLGVPRPVSPLVFEDAKKYGATRVFEGS